MIAAWACYEAFTKTHENPMWDEDLLDEFRTLHPDWYKNEAHLEGFQEFAKALASLTYREVFQIYTKQMVWLSERGHVCYQDERGHRNRIPVLMFERGR